MTELSREIVNLAMDVHGGRGIQMGPRNYLMPVYHAAPMGITVEGANILTRNMIIYGQGAIRCHPFVLQVPPFPPTFNVEKYTAGGLFLFCFLLRFRTLGPRIGQH